jgi:3-hydroxyisobutyrate dehydrogenase-like beta-hydroxyacid dehydrogenase
MAERIGHVGPGLMGQGIIKTLLAKGFLVTVFAHRDGLDLGELVRAGGKITRSLAEVAASSTVVLLTLPTSKEVEATVLGTPGLLGHLKEDSVVIDLSTSYPASTRMLAERLRGRKIAMLDSPMTGRPAQARSGELNLMVGGDRAVFERCQPIFQAIAKNVFHVGPVSHGNIIKLMNNFLSQLGNAGVAEILPLAAKCGVDLKSLYDVIRVSGGNSRAFEGAVPAIAKGDFTVSFQLALAHKDVSYVSALGKEENIPLPMVNSLLTVLDLAKAAGLGGENVTALVKMWEKIAGVEARSEKFGK